MASETLGRRDLIAALGGMAATSPLGAQAQQNGRPVIGFLSPQSPGPAMAGRIGSFLKGLAEQHYVAGENVEIDYRWAEGRYDRLPALANELVRRKVSVIAALTQDTALAAKASTSTVPIVFHVGGDPVQLRLVTAMNRPGGNATGVSMFTNLLVAKRLGLLHELVPKATAVAVLINPNNNGAESQTSEVQRAAGALGLQAHILRVGGERDLDATFENLAQGGAQALMVAADPLFSSLRVRLVALAAKYRLPAIWEWSDFVEDGGLMSYGTSILDNYRQCGVFAGKILHGAKPADLPVIQPVNFVLALNMKTARSLGLTFPPTLLALADQVIE